jgi:hypothetical protein
MQDELPGKGGPDTLILFAVRIIEFKRGRPVGIKRQVKVADGLTIGKGAAVKVFSETGNG